MPKSDCKRVLIYNRLLCTHTCYTQSNFRMLLARLIFTFINDPFLISEEADAPFSDILQTKGTNGVIQIPRANSPVKAHKSTITNDPESTQTTHLPQVANKYVMSNRKSISNKTSTPKHVYTICNEQRDIAKCENDTAEKRSATETTTPCEETIRPRASTFPGKTPRPTITINRVPRDKSVKENIEHNETDHSVRIYKTKHEHDERRTMRRDATPKPTSPTIRQSSPYHQIIRETMLSPTGRSSRNSQHLSQFRKHSALQRRFVNSQKARESGESRDSLHDDEVSVITKHVLSRPTRTNRFTRASIPVTNATNTSTILEQVSEISCPTPRPISSLNSPAQTNNFRSATPVLPSLGK